MLKKFLKLIKKNEVAKDETKQLVGGYEEIEIIDNNSKNETIKSNEFIKDMDVKNDSLDEEYIDDCAIIKEESIEEDEKIEIIVEKIKDDTTYEAEILEKNIDNKLEKSIDFKEEKEEKVNSQIKQNVALESEVTQQKTAEAYSDSDIEFIKDAKIRRGKTIKSIDLYTKEEKVFKTHSECSKKLKVPIGYIKENLKFGYTDYLGEAIMYLNKELQSNEGETSFDYLSTGKNPMEIYNNLNDRIFSSRISERKRESILSNEKIEPINMHYTFECIDKDYDDYFYKYKSIIQRGGKKKIELVDKKGEAIEIFKSLDECSSYLNKEKSDIVDMLKYGETKAGRYEIRYSLRNI